MANVKQQMIPFVTCEISFGLNVSELVFGVDVLDLDFGVQINSIEQPIKRNSVSLETCLIVGLLPLMLILITASLSSNTYNRAS